MIGACAWLDLTLKINRQNRLNNLLIFREKMLNRDCKFMAGTTDRTKKCDRHGEQYITKLIHIICS